MQKMPSNGLRAWLQRNQGTFYPVVAFAAGTDRIIHIDSSENNAAFSNLDFTDTRSLVDFSDRLLADAGAAFGIGGYDEIRPMYSRSPLFNPEPSGTGTTEPRRLHIGVDITGKAGTPVHAPCDATIHSFAFNDRFGDYGPTIILAHRVDGLEFHTLYGHLSRADLDGVRVGAPVARGTAFARFGTPGENGHWPPHLHFQVIADLEGSRGDYPGVCRVSEREKYLANCPDPDLVLDMMRWTA